LQAQLKNVQANIRPIPITIGIGRACKANQKKNDFNYENFRDHRFKKKYNTRHTADKKALDKSHKRTT